MQRAIARLMSAMAKVEILLKNLVLDRSNPTVVINFAGVSVPTVGLTNTWQATMPGKAVLSIAVPATSATDIGYTVKVGNNVVYTKAPAKTATQVTQEIAINSGDIISFLVTRGPSSGTITGEIYITFYPVLAVDVWAQ